MMWTEKKGIGRMVLLVTLYYTWTQAKLGGSGVEGNEQL